VWKIKWGRKGAVPQLTIAGFHWQVICFSDNAFHHHQGKPRLERNPNQVKCITSVIETGPRHWNIENSTDVLVRSWGRFLKNWV
jgi:hypothetical protein